MRFQVKKQRSTEMALQITSMADCFIIILVFLLKSVATGSLNVTPSKGLRLPKAAAKGQLEQALTVEISERAVQVENGFVDSLKNFRFLASELESNGTSVALNAAFDRQKKRQELIAQSNREVKVDSQIVVVADERTPYVTLKSVLAAAAVHGFTDFKLVVAKKE